MSNEYVKRPVRTRGGYPISGGMQQEWEALKATLSNNEALLVRFESMTAYAKYRYRQCARVRRLLGAGYGVRMVIQTRNDDAYTCAAWIEATNEA